MPFLADRTTSYCVLLYRSGERGGWFVRDIEMLRTELEALRTEKDVCYVFPIIFDGRLSDYVSQLAINFDKTNTDPMIFAPLDSLITLSSQLDDSVVMDSLHQYFKPTHFYASEQAVEGGSDVSKT